MKFYTKLHDFYCGIDLHARILYVCILSDKGEKVVHQKIKADKHALLTLIQPYVGQVVIGSVIYAKRMILTLYSVMRFT